MKTAPSSLLIVVVLSVAASWSAATAQNDDPQATIAALQTVVAEQAATIAALEPTAVPTAAPRATPSPDGEPLAVGNGVEVLYYEVARTDAGDAVLVGEYRNATGEAMSAPLIEVTVFDGEGNVLAAQTSSPLLPRLGPGETGPFLVPFIPVEADAWGSAALVACATEGDYDADATALLAIEGVTEGETSADWFSVSGVVRNNGGEPVEPVRVIAVLRDGRGRVVGAAATLVVAAIPAGRTAPFAVTAFGPNLAAVDGDDYTYGLVVVASSGGVGFNCPSPGTTPAA